MKVLARSLPRQMFLVHWMAALIVACCLFSFAMPQARAAALTESQKEAIVNLLKSFNADEAVVKNVQSALSGGTGNASSIVEAVKTRVGEMQKTNASLEAPRALPAVCALIARNLKKGTSGDDVNALQAFLQRTGDLQATSTTNYFGALTERALQAWQARMGIATSGDPDTTGFGALGPKTRHLVVGHCKDILGEQGTSSASIYRAGVAEQIDPNTPPTCTLTTSKSVVQAGEVVVITWKSKNATYAGSPSGEKDSIHGSRRVMPGETTTYVKKVYGPAGEGECSVTVEVSGTVPATEKKVVVAPGAVDFGRVFSLMGSGVAAVFEGYVSLFDFN